MLTNATFGCIIIYQSTFKPSTRKRVPTLYDTITPSEMECLLPLADEVSAERSIRTQKWIQNHPGMKVPSDIATTLFREAMIHVLKRVHDDSYTDAYRKVASILSKRSAENRKRKALEKKAFLPSSTRKKKPRKEKLYEEAVRLSRQMERAVQVEFHLTTQTKTPAKTNSLLAKEEKEPPCSPLPEEKIQVQPVFSLMEEVDRDCTRSWETGALRTKKHRAGRW